MKVDAHFHVFLADEIKPANRRYSVDYDAPLTQWERLARHEGIEGGVLVQPSFLGFDNSLLLNSIQQSPGTLRGVVVLDPKTTRSTLEELKEQGIQGVRLNLYGKPQAQEILRSHWRLIELINESGLHLEVHHDDGLLNTLLLEIPGGTEIVIDHFGRPKAENELMDMPGLARHAGKLWVKLSAQYRTPHLNHKKIFTLWAESIGTEKLLWGSDWPHTQFETKQAYAQQMSALKTLIGNEQLLDQILIHNPQKLYWS